MFAVIAVLVHGLSIVNLHKIRKFSLFSRKRNQIMTSAKVRPATMEIKLKVTFSVSSLFKYFPPRLWLSLTCDHQAQFLALLGTKWFWQQTFTFFLQKSAFQWQIKCNTVPTLSFLTNGTGITIREFLRHVKCAAGRSPLPHYLICSWRTSWKEQRADGSRVSVQLSKTFPGCNCFDFICCVSQMHIKHMGFSQMWLFCLPLGGRGREGMGWLCLPHERAEDARRLFKGV